MWMGMRMTIVQSNDYAHEPTAAFSLPLTQDRDLRYTLIAYIKHTVKMIYLNSIS